MRAATSEPEPRDGILTSAGRWLGLPILAAALAALYLLSRANYLLFHALVETFAVVVACGVFMLAWNSRRFQANGFFLCLGSASLFVAGVDFLHTVAYKNMGVFPGAGPNLPTQLWVVARYLQAAALVLAPLWLSRKGRPGLLFGGWLAATVLLLAAVFGGVFPDCFVEGRGLTPFKVGSEYLVIMGFIVSLALLHRRRDTFDPGVLRLLSLALGAFIFAELSFTLYTDVFGISNMAGHLLKVAGFYCIYRGVIETGLTRPYDLLFRELKESEEALRQRSLELEETNCELEAANEELEATNDQLEAANRELEVANGDLEAFNYSVSHDLRGPLTVISGQCQVIQHIFADRVDPEVREFIQGIYAETGRMNGLISTLLDFARLGKVELRRQRCDLSVMAQTIAGSLALRDPDRRVVFDLAAGVEAEADPALAQVVLENLLGNAWKYTGQAEEARIAFGAAEVEGGRAFFVRDNGVGFDPARVADLFAPFKRLHAGEQFEGFGIGLATVQRIVARHGGRIWAEGAPGLGATFYFTL
jgi:signal transduction histidine kinase